MVRAAASLVILITLALFAIDPLLIARAQPSAQSPEARRDEIARVQEMLADPDPLMRLANMEAIVKSGDPLKLQVALRIAFGGDDEELHALALRAYLTTRKEITFTILLPQGVQAEGDAARADKVSEQAFYRKYPFINLLASLADRLKLVFPDYAFGQDRGTVNWGGRISSFTITGDRLVMTMDIWGTCHIEFVPTKRRTFEGTFACPSWPALQITAPSL